MTITYHFPDGTSKPKHQATLDDADLVQKISTDQALRMIRDRSESIEREANEALGDGDQDDFRYLRQPYFCLSTHFGVFVAEIVSAGGEGRVSPSGVGDFDNTHIDYKLHALIVP